MSNGDKKMIACLDNMTLEQARRELAWGRFGDPGSPNHDFASKWLEVKEAEERDNRDLDAISIAKEANKIASNALDTARKNERWAMWATIIAAIAIIIAAMAYIKTS